MLGKIKAIELIMKIYHWVYIVLIVSTSLLQLVDKLFITEGGVATQLLPFLVATILTGATMGKMNQQALLYRWFWFVSFWLLIFGEISLLSFSVYLFWQQGVAASLHITIYLMVMTMAVPGLIALYQYVYLSKAVWQPSPKQE